MFALEWKEGEKEEERRQMTSDGMPIGVPQSMFISRTVLLEASAVVGFVLYRHFQSKLHLRQARHRISFLREMQGRGLLDKLCQIGGVSVRNAASTFTAERSNTSGADGGALNSSGGSAVTAQKSGSARPAYAYRVPLLPQSTDDNFLLYPDDDDLVIPLVSTARLDTTTTSAKPPATPPVPPTSADDETNANRAPRHVSIHISYSFFSKLGYGNRLFSFVESLFLVYASVLGCPSAADPYVLVDLWNIISCVCQRFLVALLAHNSRCLRDGGVGEIPEGWEAVASLAKTLWNDYHIEKEPTVQRWLSAEPQVNDVAAVPIFTPNEKLVAEVIRIVQMHQSRVSLVKNGLRVVFQGVTNMRCIVPLVAGVVALRIANEFNFGMGDVCGSRVAREWSTFRGIFSSGREDNMAQQLMHISSSSSHSSRWVLSALQTVGVAVVRGLQSVLESSLRFASLNFLCALGETYLTETLALQLNGGLEGDIVMHVAAQDTARLDSRWYIAALGGLSSSNSNLAFYVVNWVSEGAAYGKALLAARQFPAYVLAESLLRRAFAVLEKTFVLAMLTNDAVRDFYRKDEAISSAVPINTMFGGEKTNNCLVDDASITRGDDLRFAQVERRFLLAAIPDEVRDAMPARLHALDSQQQYHKTHKKETVVLQKLLDEAGVLTARSDAMFGLALLLRVSVPSQCQRHQEGDAVAAVGAAQNTLRAALRSSSFSAPTGMLAALVALAPVVEWPVDPSFGAESTVRDILCLLQSPQQGGAGLQQQQQQQSQRERAAAGRLQSVLLPDSDIPALVRLVALLGSERAAIQRPSPRDTEETSVHSSTPARFAEPTVISQRKDNDDDDYVELPQISSAVLKRDLLGALRNAGCELDVVKACALGGAYTLQTSTDNSSASHYAQLNFLKSFLDILKQYLVRSVGYWKYGTEFASRATAEEQSLDSAARRLDSLVGCGGNGFQSPPSNHDGSGVEMLRRRAAQVAISGPFNSDGRGALTYMLFQNLICSRARCIDRPFAATLGLVPRSSSSSSKSDVAASFSVEFCNVSKSFGHRKVLDGVSFTLRRGEFLGIVGATGSGKTTILNLLLRLYEPDSGVILVNRTPITEIPVRMLRRRIAYVCQDFLSNGFDSTWSVEDNLALGDLSRDNMEDAMSSALWQSDAKSVVMSKPLKMKTLAVPSQFSGGEVQRLVIARALMRDPKQTGLLVLDEATSALDGATEKLVVENMFGGRRLSAKNDRLSCIAVAHRLATLISADKILVLEDGKVIEQGSWSRLAKKKDSHFRKLLEQQTVRGEVLDDAVSEEMVMGSSGMPSRATTLSFSAESPMSGGALSPQAAAASVSAAGPSPAMRVLEALQAIANGGVEESIACSLEVQATARRALAALHATNSTEAAHV